MSRADDLDAVDAALTRIGRLANSRRVARYRSEMSGVDLSPTTVATLAAVYRLGRGRLTAVAALVDLEPSRVSKEVTRLVEAGLVAQEPDASDGRATLLACTEAGEDAFRRYRATADQILAERLQGWSDRDLSRLAELLGRLAGTLAGDADADADAAAPR